MIRTVLVVGLLATLVPTFESSPVGLQLQPEEIAEMLRLGDISYLCDLLCEPDYAKSLYAAEVAEKTGVDARLFCWLCDDVTSTPSVNTTSTTTTTTAKPPMTTQPPSSSPTTTPPPPSSPTTTTTPSPTTTSTSSPSPSSTSTSSSSSSSSSSSTVPPKSSTTPTNSSSTPTP